MSKQIRLINSNDEELFKLKNHFIDACQSHTIIYNSSFFSVFRIFDKIASIDTDCNRFRINYSSGAYLLIKP
jgi:hypothetical protein